jgi:hypothetical protein
LCHASAILASLIKLQKALAVSEASAFFFTLTPPSGRDFPVRGYAPGAAPAGSPLPRKSRRFHQLVPAREVSAITAIIAATLVISNSASTR